MGVKFTVLIIYILKEVQTNDLNSISFHSSSLPIPLSHSSILDKFFGPFFTCLDEKFK